MRVQVVLCKRDENRKIRKRMWDVKVGKKGGEIWVGWQFFSRFLAVSLGSWMGSLGGKKVWTSIKGDVYTDKVFPL